MNIKFKSLIDTLNILDKSKKTYKSFSKLIEVIIFNMIAFCYSITVMNNNKKIKLDDIYIVKDFIIDKLEINYFKGGTTLPSSYFGDEEKMYNVENKDSDLLQINFEGGLARAQIGGGGQINN